MQEDVEEAFWWFVDQNWKDSLNVASADSIGNEASLEASYEARQLAMEIIKNSTAESQRKPAENKVTTANAEVRNIENMEKESAESGFACKLEDNVPLLLRSY